MRLTNPLEEDPLLKELLKQLDRIETRRGFAKWKAQFLEQFETHLEGTNVTKAGQKYHSFAKRLDRLALLLKQLEGLITAGECSTDFCSVKSRQCLAELQKHLTGLIEHCEALVPGTLEMEREAGYTKFDMGAVLVRDGFVEYDRLCICNEILRHMLDLTLSKVADKQLLEEMERYWQKVEAFYQIMGTDLGLHGAIVKCREILRADDDEFYEMQQEDTVSDMSETNSSAYHKKSASVAGTTKSLYDDSESESNHDEAAVKPAATKGPTEKKFQKVEIYGLDLPLRLIKIGDNLDEDSETDLSSVSDYESWCWELELPEPAPKKKVKQSDSIAGEIPEDTATGNEDTEADDDDADDYAKDAKKETPMMKPSKASNAAKKDVEMKQASGSDDMEGDGGPVDKNLRYKWTGKDYYQGSNDWRIAGKLKKIGKDED